jgi:hypothetical protein
VVDLVNRLEIETRNGRQGRLAEHLTRMVLIPVQAAHHNEMMSPAVTE